MQLVPLTYQKMAQLENTKYVVIEAAKQDVSL